MASGRQAAIVVWARPQDPVRRVQVFSHCVIPSILPSLLGIAPYRLDENIRSSRSLGFVGAAGIGFEPLSAMSLFRACRRPRTAI
jgi:ABC-type phosphate/phosphonate transport system permease subunit